MSDDPDMDRQVTFTIDLATLILFQEAVGFAGFHDPILDHLSDRQQKVLWAGSDILLDALRAFGITDWDSAQTAAERHWDSRRNAG